MPTGLEDWFMNFTHVVRSAVTSESLANIPRPYSELAIFGIFKGGEIASFIGGCLVHPIYRFILIKRLTSETTTNNSYKIIRARCRKLQGRFLIGGLLIGPVASMIYASKHTASDVKQICYKIRCDDKNMTLDRTSLAFGLVGWYWKRFQGAVDGVNIALAYCLLLLATSKKRSTPFERLPRATDITSFGSLQPFFQKSSTLPTDAPERENNGDENTHP